jgi:hypothetical protein
MAGRKTAALDAAGLAKKGRRAPPPLRHASLPVSNINRDCFDCAFDFGHHLGGRIRHLMYGLGVIADHPQHFILRFGANFECTAAFWIHIQTTQFFVLLA